MKLLNHITNILMDPAAMKAAMIAIPLIAMPLTIKKARRCPSKASVKKKQLQRIIQKRLKSACSSGDHNARQHKNNKHTNLLILASTLLLSGCTGTTYSSHFDCPLGQGARCSSISKVNRMIDLNQIDLGEEVATNLGQNGSQKQVYIYYGPEQLTRLVSITPQEG